MRRAVKLALAVAAGLVLLLLIAFGLMQTAFGKRQLLALIEDQLSDPPARLEARALEGFVPFDMTLVGASLSDARGIWLEADRLSLSWAPGALIGGTVAIEDLAADRIGVLRSPISPPSPPSDEPTRLELPRLPVEIDLRRLVVERLELGPEFLGEPAAFAVQAQARLGDPADGLQATLNLNRIDRDLDRVNLTLDYRPAADTLSVDVKAEEPQGGLITNLIGLPGAPKFALSLSGSGPLANWQAKGQATSDERPLLDLTATSQGPAQDRTIGFNARLHEAPMLSADLAPLVEGGVTADGQVHISQRDQPIRIDRLKVETRAGSITAQGSIAPEQTIDLTADVRLADSAPFAALLPPELRWDGATARLHLVGPIAAPELSAEGRVSNFAYAENRIGDGQVRLSGTLDTEAMRADAVRASIAAGAVTVADPQLQSLLVDGATLTFAGALDESGAIEADQLKLSVGSAVLDLNGTATGWGEDSAQVEGRLDIADLAPILRLAGLEGQGALGADLVVARADGALTVQLEAAAENASIGIPDADRLIGVAPKLSVIIRQDATGLLTIETAKLDSVGIVVTAAGTMTPDRILDLSLDAALDDLGRVLPNGKGALTVGASITGSAENPVAKLQIGSARLQVDRFTVARLSAAVDATDLATAPKASIDAKAQINALAATVRGRAGFDPESGRVSVSDVAARLGSTSIDGGLDVIDGLLNGDFALSSPALDELAPMAGIDLRGGAEGNVALRIRDGKQGVSLDVTAKSLDVSDVRIGTAQVNATADDAFGDPQLDATLVAGEIEAGGQSISRLEARATGRVSDLAISADATGEDLAATAQANLRSSDAQTSIALGRLDLDIRGVNASLQGPAEITLGESSTRIANLVIASGGGTAALDASLGGEGNRIALTLNQLPASLAEAAAPDLNLLGTVDGTLQLDGPTSAPRATIALQGKGLGVSGASAELVDLSLNGNWAAGQFKASGRATLSEGSGLDFSAAVPMAADPGSGLPMFNPAAPLTASAQGEIDLGIANAFIPGGADHIAGHAAVDLAAQGAVARPILSGRVAITEGRYENQRYGTRLRDLTAVLEGSGSKLRLASLSARTPGGGTLSGEGDLDFADSMPVSISIRMDRARMINAPIGTAVTDGDLQVTGTMTSDLAITGKVRIVRAEIRIPDKLPVDVEEIAVQEINLPPARQSVVDAAAEAPPPKTVEIGLDLSVDAPEQVFVRGRGLDAEMGGALQIGGTADAPIITGALQLRRGDFNLLSRRLEFSRGTVTFSGGTSIDPILDFAATTRLPEADVIVAVTGSAVRPEIAVTSSPALPQDEVLARLLFGKASGALSPFEALQLAQAMAELTGIEAGPGVLDKIRKTLGLDRLDVGAGEGEGAGGPSLSAGRYVTRGVFVGAKQGTTPGSSAATVEIEITPNVKVETDVGADSSGKAGINLEWNY